MRFIYVLLTPFTTSCPAIFEACKTALVKSNYRIGFQDFFKNEFVENCQNYKDGNCYEYQAEPVELMDKSHEGEYAEDAESKLRESVEYVPLALDGFIAAVLLQSVCVNGVWRFDFDFSL
jgi:hypothetical protein